MARVDEAKKQLREALEYSYGKQLEQSNKDYDLAINSQDRAMLARGMQRSSYGMQAMAGMQDKKVQAANDIRNAMEADYNNRAYQIERDAISDDRYDQQWAYQQERDKRADYESDRAFEESVRQYNQGYEYQQSRDAVADQQWQQQFEYNQQRANRADYESDRNYQYQLGRDTVADTQWQKNYEYQLNRAARADYESDRAFGEQVRQADRSYERGVYESDRNFDYQLNRAERADAESDRNYYEQQRQFDANLGWAKEESTRNFEESKRQYEQNYAHQVSQDELAQQNFVSQLNETIRSNLANEKQAMKQLAETNRSNLANEAQAKAQLAEATRSNKANEALNQQQLAEAIRSNQAQEQMAKDQLAETMRQYDNNYLYQASRDAVADQQWSAAFNQGVKEWEASDANQKASLAIQEAAQKLNELNSERSQGNTDREYYSSLATAALQNGQMPSADILAKAGMDTETANKYIDAYNESINYRNERDAVEDARADRQIELQENADARADRQLELQELSTNWSTKGQTAMTMLQGGQMPGPQMLADLGLTEKNAKKLMKALQTLNSSTSSGGSGGSGGSTSSDKEQAVKEVDNVLKEELGIDLNLSGEYQKTGKVTADDVVKVVTNTTKKAVAPALIKHLFQ